MPRPTEAGRKILLLSPPLLSPPLPAPHRASLLPAQRSILVGFLTASASSRPALFVSLGSGREGHGSLDDHDELRSLSLFFSDESEESAALSSREPWPSPPSSSQSWSPRRSLAVLPRPLLRRVVLAAAAGARPRFGFGEVTGGEMRAGPRGATAQPMQRMHHAPRMVGAGGARAGGWASAAVMWCSGAAPRGAPPRAGGARAAGASLDEFRRAVRGMHGDRGAKAGAGAQQQKHAAAALRERRGVEAAAVSTAAEEAVQADDDAAQRSGYPFREIEGKWQRYWEENRTFSTARIDGGGLDTSRPKFYALDMFPYPSGAGLHVGHPEGYTATDIISRYKRMRGYNVLHPMGWDAFGLPAEQYALQTGTHPEVTTRKNIGRFKSQLKVRRGRGAPPSVPVPVVVDAAAKGLGLPFSGRAEGENVPFCLQDQHSRLLR